MKKKIRITLAVFLPIQVIAINLLAQHPTLIEKYYSHHIFSVVSFIERFCLGWIPFSVGDLLYLSFALLLIRWLYKRFKTRFKDIKTWGLQALSTLSILYFCFHLFWGMNYYRLPLHKSLHIKATYSHSELVALTHKLIKKANSYQEKLAKNDSTAVHFSFTQQQVRQLAIVGYQNIAHTFPELNYHTPSIKSSLYSWPLTYMGFSGYINPLTNEAQINSTIPPFNWPSVTAHEMGHQLGFAKENEANFMACLVTINHPNPYFKYAGYTFALQYCLNEVYTETPVTGKKLINELHLGVRKNYREANQFWQEHQNILAPIFKLFYGHYLKANNQPKGMQSYNYVVALLVNYYRDRPLP